MSDELYVDETRPKLDYNSPDWHRIVDFLKETSSDLTKQVLGKGVTERDADFFRGRILQIEQILDWSPYAGR
jgi:hypothetical protein